MMHFCTYFDVFYLHRGLALYRSIDKHIKGPFTFWILCFDTNTYNILHSLNLRNVRLIRQEEFENKDNELLPAKVNRSRIEYYWTCTPSLPLYLLKHNPDIDVITYVDSDYAFFASPEFVLSELSNGSILICPHDYSPEYAGESHSGKYNVGLMSFRADSYGIECLEWWRKKCIEWCYARHEDGRFGDQGYLNDWPERFSNVIVSQNIGLNAAPWNISKYRVTTDFEKSILINTKPLICFHYHAVNPCTRWLTLVASWNINISAETKRLIYGLYMEELIHLENLLKENGSSLPLPRSGFPWRYIGGRIMKMQPLQHFLITLPKYRAKNS